jgi:hypothetical protein
LLYNSASAANGTTTYPGDLVESFKVNQPNLLVTALAAYDSFKNGITSNIFVGLFNDTTNSVAIAAVNFNGTAYNGTGGSYFDTKAIAPYSLVSGDTYSIEAWGFSDTDGFFSHFGGGGASFNPSTYSLSDVPTTLSAAVGNSASNVDGTTTGGLVNGLCQGNTTACQASPNYLRFSGTDFAAAGSLEISEVPGPIAGAGLPGLVFATLGLLGWGWRRKRAASSGVLIAA